MRYLTFTGISAFLAFIISAGPFLGMLLGGLYVPMVYQAGFTGPAQPMRANDTWIQTFIFPDRPIQAVAVRPGTYGRRPSGKVNVWVGAAYIPRSSNEYAFGRTFDIDLGTLQDSRMQTYRFPALQFETGTRGLIRFGGTDIPDGQVLTFWKNISNAYPDGRLLINGHIQRGDLVFKIYSRVRGLDTLRMVKSRWQTGLPDIWATVFWPSGLCVSLFFSVFACFVVVFSGIKRSCV